MEQLTQKYSKYFYIMLIVTIIIQLLDTIFTTVSEGSKLQLFILILLSITNIMLLINSIKFNIKQQFTECKINAKVLRVSLVLLIVFHTICIESAFSKIAIRDYILSTAIVELVLTYRIKSIEYLEKLASRFSKVQYIRLKEDK
jgi:hypothetical protein